MRRDGETVKSESRDKRKSWRRETEEIEMSETESEKRDREGESRMRKKGETVRGERGGDREHSRNDNSG